MNKILVDGDKLFLTSEIHDITVSGMATILINNIKENIDLNINLEDDAILSIYDFNGNNKKDTKIVVTQNNNTKCDYYHTFKIDSLYNFSYKVKLIGDNNYNSVNISGVTNGEVYMDIDADLIKKTKNNEVNENIKVLTENGKAFISPMLHVSALDVIANHNTAISNVRSDELFYLMSKGIDRESSIKLIEDGYIYGYMKKFNEEFYNLIKEEE